MISLTDKFRMLFIQMRNSVKENYDITFVITKGNRSSTPLNLNINSSRSSNSTTAHRHSMSNKDLHIIRRNYPIGIKFSLNNQSPSTSSNKGSINN